jgi:GntR family transcriptional regulator, sialic acid-inducible nan operon repressor
MNMRFCPDQLLDGEIQREYRHIADFGQPNHENLTPKIEYGLLTPTTGGGIRSVSETVSASSIANALAGDVHSGALVAGQMLPSERDLCTRFGVGRNVVREATTILQGMGLADHSKGKRPRVAAPALGRVMLAASEAARFFFTDTEGRAHLEQARLFLETSMVRYAVEHATNAQIAKMISAIEECEANLGDIQGFRIADVKFHRALAEVPGNPIFVALHETFVEQLMKNTPMHDDFETHNQLSNAGHRETMQALLAKDTDGAVQALTRHLERNYESTLHRTLQGRVAENS